MNPKRINKKYNNLATSYSGCTLETGVDEAGRGALAGPVVAAAVILSSNFSCPKIQDSKLLKPEERLEAREYILQNAIGWGLGISSVSTIDAINILNATICAMNEALMALPILPEFILVDGNRFQTHLSIPYRCIVGGDKKYLCIAAASILAKTYRDEIMEHLAKLHPLYAWESNKGYPTPKHREAIAKYGLTPWHRRTFMQLKDQEA
ncbi:MAG: ribonuclease HII [Bacteroidia bacterium]|nr:ribonuclease HII [Bacteroidia bacterium]MDW8159698.1 ribonuclease HII [Bacteroidia bacterium]